MKFCENCGTKLTKTEKFCSKCGKGINEIKDNSNNAKSNNKNDGLGTASFVLGIVALASAFSFTIGAFPIALTGLIIGIVYKNQHGGKSIGIILNTVAMVVSILFFALFIMLFAFIIAEEDINDYAYEEPETYEDYDSEENINYEDMIGTWNCKSFDKVLGGNYQLTVKLNADRSFVLGDYNSISNNYIKGTYEVDDEDETVFKDYSYYLIDLEPSIQVVNGVSKSVYGDDSFEYEMAVTKFKNGSSAVLTAEKNNKVYYCYNK